MVVYKVKSKSGQIRYRAEVNVGYALNGKKDVRTKTSKTRKDAER